MPLPRIFERALLVTILLSAGCGGGAPEAPPEAPPPEAPVEARAPAALSAPLDGTLLLVSERSGGPEVWAVSLSDGAENRVVGEPGATFPAAPDPQGTHALVISVEESEEIGHREMLWLVALDGSDPRRLVPPAGMIRNPSWAPDGSWVALEADAASYRDLYRVDRAGGEATRLTSARHGSFEPAISPKGDRIVFGTSRDGNAEIYVMNADGSEQRRLTDSTADDTMPGWDPTGTTISWLSDQQGAPRVWLMDADGGNARPVRPLGDARAVDHTYAWSPDGSRLAIAVQTGPKQIDIHVVDPNTGEQLALIGGPGVDEHPAWSPDGRYLAFSSARGGDTDIYVATADGSAMRRITTSVGPDWLPRWVAAP